LEEPGYKVLVATSGAEALQLFAAHPVDLVLLDYHMPGMNGDVVAEHMKAGRTDVPIALLSADDEPPERALRWVDAFVSKSESPANLLQIVEHLLDLRLLFAPLNGLTGWRRRRAA
jgi:CheY-like chemotaxis protein